MIVTTAIVLVVYGLTLPPDLTWAGGSIDGGELITASVTLGIAHPPGYMTYVLLGKLFSFVPIGTVAFRYNLFSALCMAVAAGLLVGTISRITQPAVKPFTAITAALIFAFTPLVWGQAIVAEVYALNLFFLSAFLFVTIRQGTGFVSGVLLGLALTTHLTSVLMLPLAFLMPVTRHRQRLMMGLIIGLIPLLAAPILAQGNSPVVWGDATSLSGWWWLVSGRLYQANVQFSPDTNHLLELLRAVVLGPGLMIAGRSRILQLAVPQDGKRATTWQFAALFAGTTGLYFAFALLYDTPDAAVLLIPGLMLLAILLAPVFQPLRSFALLIPAILALVVFPDQNLRHDDQVRPLAESVLQVAPEGAILLTPGDRTIFTLWYFQQVEQQRPDIYLVDSNLYAFDWYRAHLSRLYPELWVSSDDDLAAFQAHNLENHPLCVAGLVTIAAPWPDAAPTYPLLSGLSGPQLSCLEKSP